MLWLGDRLLHRHPDAAGGNCLVCATLRSFCSGAVASTLVQTRLYLDAPEQVASSVMALYVVALVGFNAVGGMLGGSLAQFSGLTPAVTLIALVGMVVPLLLQ